MTTVAVLGASGPVGRALLERLDADRAVESIVGVDLTEPEMPVAKLQFRTADVRDRLLPVALDGADAVVHAALVPDPSPSEDTVFAINVSGTRNILDATDRAGARKLVVISSAAVYGAHPDNAVPLDEDAPLRANPDFGFAYQRQLVEELVAEWAALHPDVAVTVLRPAILLGPGVDHFVCRLLEAPRLLTVKGYEPPLQFAHVDDVAAAAHLAVSGDLRGPFNVAAEGWLSFDDVRHLLGKRTTAVPETVAFETVGRLWAHHAVPTPPGVLHFLMHPWIVACDRLRAHGWAPLHSNREILREFATSHGGWLSIGVLRCRRRDLYSMAFAATGVLLGLAVVGWRRTRLGQGRS